MVKNTDLEEKKPEIEPNLTRTEAEEKKWELVNTPLSIPSMPLTDMRKLPLSEIIAIKKSMEPKKQEAVASVQDPSLKLLMPKEQICDKPLLDTSPLRMDEYSNWDSLEWNPFKESVPKDETLILPDQQLQSDFVTNIHSGASGTDGQSDTDSGHWTAAQEERSSLRSSPRTALFTPTRDPDGISLQSEDSVDREVNYSPFEPPNFNVGPNLPPSTGLPPNMAQTGNIQQVPNQFTPATGPGQNLQQAPWFNMAMQCWAQQYMTQMQLMATQMQSNSFNPWMMPNQNNNSSTPMSHFQAPPPGFMNQVPSSQASGSFGHINSQFTDQRQADQVIQMQSGIPPVNNAQTSVPYVPAPQQNVANSSSVSSGTRSSVVTVQPGTVVTVSQPEHSSHVQPRDRERSRKPRATNKNAQGTAESVGSDDSVPANIQKKNFKGTKAISYLK